MAFNPLTGLLRWLACHLVLLGFLGFGVWGYAWRAELLPDLGAWWPRQSWEVPVARPAPVRLAPPTPVSRGPAVVFRPPEPVPVQPDADELLQSARRAYWDGDWEQAEARYLEYLARYPDDPDGYGELGNLLQELHRDAEAHTAFYEAIVRLRAAGREEALAPLLQVLRDAGDERASLLAD